MPTEPKYLHLEQHFTLYIQQKKNSLSPPISNWPMYFLLWLCSSVAHSLQKNRLATAFSAQWVRSMTDLNQRHIHVHSRISGPLCGAQVKNILGECRAVLAGNTGNVAERSLLSACKIA